MLEKNQDRILNTVVIIIYAISLSIVTYFHEPCFDEAQAYLIARDTSLFDIIFTVPHYEGHPFLWHLYLVPFARGPLPFEVGIKSASIIINVLAMGLLIFKAPFKKLIRYTIPFTYYFFFFFGVVSRCYSITMLGFVLMAIAYKNKDKKPVLYVMAMALTCLSSAYGIVLCGGLSIVWLIDIIKKGGFLHTLKNVFKDRRLISLSVLFILAVILIYLIIPYSDTIGAYYRTYPQKDSPFISRLFYMIVLAPAEALFAHYFSGNYYVVYLNIPFNVIITGTIAFALLAFILYIVVKSKSKLKELIIPYLLFSIFSALMYFSEHHIGIITYFLVFILWICFYDKSPIKSPKWLIRTKADIKKTQIMLQKLLSLFTAFCIIMSLYWTASITYKDILYPYDLNRDIAHFVKKNNMKDALIMSYFSLIYHQDGDETISINIQRSATFNAYFNSNIVYSLNDGQEGYVKHFHPDEAYIEDTLTKLRSYGAPEILIGKVDLEFIFGDEITYDNYSPVYVVSMKYFSKDDYYESGNKVIIYLRNDLLDKYDLERVYTNNNQKN